MRWRREARSPRPKLQRQRRAVQERSRQRPRALQVRVNPAIWRKAAKRRARGRLRPLPGHPGCQPQEAATRNQVRRLKRANIHYELEFRPQPSHNLVGALGCACVCVCVCACVCVCVSTCTLWRRTGRPHLLVWQG